MASVGNFTTFPQSFPGRNPSNILRERRAYDCRPPRALGPCAEDCLTPTGRTVLLYKGVPSCRVTVHFIIIITTIYMFESFLILKRYSVLAEARNYWHKIGGFGDPFICVLVYFRNCVLKKVLVLFCMGFFFFSWWMGCLFRYNSLLPLNFHKIMQSPVDFISRVEFLPFSFLPANLTLYVFYLLSFIGPFLRETPDSRVGRCPRLAS